MKHHVLLQKLIFLGVFIGGFPQAMAAESVDIYLLNESPTTHGIGEKIGSISFEDSKKGLVIHPSLTGLPKGEHGFHVHEKPSCEGGEKDGKWVKGQAAGAHLDPQHTGKHLGPKGKGHAGDLPVLVVSDKGEANTEVVVERLKVADLKGHAIVIHEGGDNYSDNPPMGGGGARIACGVVL